MTALAIVAFCAAGTFVYCASSVYVYLRVLWYLKQDGNYDPEMAAFIWAFFLPAGVMLLLIRSTTGADSNGLAPRAIRRDRKIKEQEREIARLEQELGIR